MYDDVGYLFYFVGMGNGEDFEDDSIDIYAYFNSTCYDGFFDDEQVTSQII